MPEYSTIALRQTHQSDHRFARYKQRFGCLLFVLISLIEHHLATVATVSDKRRIYERALREGAIEENTRVLNHEHVLNIVLDILGGWPEYRAHYVAIEYPDGTKRIFEGDYYRDGLANAWAAEWDVVNAASHFNQVTRSRVVVYEPMPGLELGKLVSDRLYYIRKQRGS